MDKNKISIDVARTIGRLNETESEHRQKIEEIRAQIVSIVRAAGGRIPFVLPDKLRQRNDAARRAAVTAAPDEESRRTAEAWRGPHYGEALRTGSFGLEYPDENGEPTYGFIDGIEADADGGVAVLAVGEDAAIVGNVEKVDRLSLADIADPMPVLQFIESAIL